MQRVSRGKSSRRSLPFSRLSATGPEDSQSDHIQANVGPEMQAISSQRLCMWSPEALLDG